MPHLRADGGIWSISRQQPHVLGLYVVTATLVPLLWSGLPTTVITISSGGITPSASISSTSNETRWL